MPVLRTKELPKNHQFTSVNDEKLRLTLVGLADKYSENIRTLIYMCYNDNKIAQMYRAIRNSGIYDAGSRGKVHKKVIEFPNAFVYDFCNTILTSLYGENWLENKKALNHELVKPWWVVEKI